MSSSERGRTPSTAPGRQPVRTRGLVSRAMEEQFAHLHPLWVEQHLRLLVAIRQTFGNDIDMPIILGVIGQRILKAAKPHDYSRDQAFTGDLAVDHGQLTNIESIALATGIPRETVRRKVLELVAAGWVERLPGGRLWITPETARATQSITDTANDMLDALFEALANALALSGALDIQTRP